MKMVGRLGRNPLMGALGDALHAVMCGTGYNIRWLLRAMVRLGLRGLLLRLLALSAWLAAASSRPEFEANRRSANFSWAQG
jgi:IS5 family transposase